MSDDVAAELLLRCLPIVEFTTQEYGFEEWLTTRDDLRRYLGLPSSHQDVAP